MMQGEKENSNDVRREREFKGCKERKIIFCKDGSVPRSWAVEYKFLLPTLLLPFITEGSRVKRNKTKWGIFYFSKIL